MIDKSIRKIFIVPLFMCIASNASAAEPVIDKPPINAGTDSGIDGGIDDGIDDGIDSTVDRANISRPQPSESRIPDRQQDIKLNSDSSILNGRTHIFEHCGNAVLTQGGITLKANCLIGKKNSDGSYAYIKAVGSPAFLVRIDKKRDEKLEARAKSIDYLVQEKQFILTDEADFKLSQQKSLTREQGSIQVLADKITLEDTKTTNKEITATGSPLQMELIKSGESELKAQAKRLYYNIGTSDLKLSKNVVANLALGQITAGVFEYNSKTKISSFKKSSDEQIEIIQTKKQPK